MTGRLKTQKEKEVKKKKVVLLARFLFTFILFCCVVLPLAVDRQLRVQIFVLMSRLS